MYVDVSAIAKLCEMARPRPVKQVLAEIDDLYFDLDIYAAIANEDGHGPDYDAAVLLVSEIQADIDALYQEIADRDYMKAVAAEPDFGPVKYRDETRGQKKYGKLRAHKLHRKVEDRSYREERRAKEARLGLED